MAGAVGIAAGIVGIVGTIGMRGIGIGIGDHVLVFVFVCELVRGPTHTFFTFFFASRSRFR